MTGLILSVSVVVIRAVQSKAFKWVEIVWRVPDVANARLPIMFEGILVAEDRIATIDDLARPDFGNLVLREHERIVPPVEHLHSEWGIVGANEAAIKRDGNGAAALAHISIIRLLGHRAFEHTESHFPARDSGWGFTSILKFIDET